MAKQWLMGLIIIAAALAGAWYLMQPPEQTVAQAGEARSSNVNVISPWRGEVEDRLQAVGTTAARHAVDIVSEVDGRIVEINFDEGQAVEEGQVLVSLDDRQARADLKVAEARLRDAEAKYQRAARLERSNSVSEAEVGELQAARAVARANVESARIRLENHRILAPFDGVVGLREVSVGAYLTAGDMITTLDTLKEMQVVFSVPQGYLGQLQVGQPLAISIDAFPGETFRGEVTELGSRIDPLSRTITVQGSVQNLQGRLRPGQFLTLALTLDRREAILIPEQAVLTQGRDQYVFTVVDGRAQRTALKLGKRLAGKVEVLEGITLEDRVIINGQDGLRTGDRLNIIKDESALLSGPIHSRAEDSRTGEEI